MHCPIYCLVTYGIMYAQLIPVSSSHLNTLKYLLMGTHILKAFSIRVLYLCEKDSQIYWSVWTRYSRLLWMIITSIFLSTRSLERFDRPSFVPVLIGFRLNHSTNSNHLTYTDCTATEICSLYKLVVILG